MTKFWPAALAIIGACLYWTQPVLAFQQVEPAGEIDYSVADPRIKMFIREALDRNHQLRQALAEYRTTIQRIPQVSALPDPTVTFTHFVRSPETRVGPQTYGLMLSQQLPWFGTLSLRKRIAVHEASAMFEQYRALERKLAARVKDALYEVAYVDRALEITREEEALLAHYEQLSQTRYATGQGLQQSVIKIQAELTQILNRFEVLAQQRESAVGRLNTLRNRSPETPMEPIRLAELLPDRRQANLDLNALYETAEVNRPELRMALDEIEENTLRVELARKDYWPDLTMSAGMVNVSGREDAAGSLPPPPNNGKNVISFSIGVNIPVARDKYRAAELAAGEQVVAGRSRYEAALNEMKFEIRDQVSRIETLDRQLELYDQLLIPQGDSALTSAESAYEAGLVGALDLLDSERFRLDVRQARARLATDYLKALAHLEQALGVPFPES